MIKLNVEIDEPVVTLFFEAVHSIVTAIFERQANVSAEELIGRAKQAGRNGARSSSAVRTGNAE